MRRTITSRRRSDDRDRELAGPHVRYPSPGTCAPSPVAVPHTGSGDVVSQPASSADHALIQQLLHLCGQRVSAAEFQAQLEAPAYDPSSRLLLHSRGHVVGHIRRTPVDLHFGQATIAACDFSELATLPERSGSEDAIVLIREAERAARAAGAVLAITRTSVTQPFQRCGWVVGPRHTFSTANAQLLLSVLRAPPPPVCPLSPSNAVPPPSVRQWRRVEQAALMQLYDEATRGSFGAPVRGEEFWTWLINRGSFDRLYIAVNGSQRSELSAVASTIQGYAVLRQAHLVECVVSRQHPEAATALLTRACDDALERDWHPLRIDAPPDSGLHELVRSVGGRHCQLDVDQGQAVLCRVLDPVAFVRAAATELAARAQAADLPATAELGIACAPRRWRLRVTRRDAQLSEESAGRGQITLSSAGLTRLLVGRISVAELQATGQLQTSSRAALEMAAALFPARSWWLPAWEKLPTRG